jgi:hypothetical protein
MYVEGAIVHLVISMPLSQRSIKSSTTAIVMHLVVYAHVCCRLRVSAHMHLGKLCSPVVVGLVI